MARPQKAKLRFRDDLDALYLAVLLLENGFTAERVTEVILDKFNLVMSPEAVEDWSRFWKNFAITRVRDSPVVESR